MKTYLGLAATATLLLLSSFLVSCGPKDSDKIGDAQLCLDTATAATVNECVEKVAGLESAGAYVIRCSANFISEGFSDPNTIVNTFKSLSDDPTNGTKAFLSAMVFSSVTVANTTYSNCQKTGQKGFTLLAMAVQSATNILALGMGLIGTLPPNPTPADIATAINAITGGGDPAATAAAASAVGTAVVQTYQVTCLNGSQTNVTLCDQMSAAFTAAGSQDPATVGLAIINQWKNH